MIPVIRHVNARKRDLEGHPFLKFLEDDTVGAESRMAFAPCLAPFVMGFADVNILGLRDEPSEDRFQQLVNDHSHEDDYHWPMYLDDLRTLELDTPRPLTETLEMLWSGDRIQTRRLTYGLMALARSADPALRIALVEAIEATGYVAWKSFLVAANAYTELTGRQLHYFGPEHAELETGHAMGADDIDHELRSIELSPQQREQAIAMVDEVFDLFTQMFAEQLEFAERQAEREPAYLG